MRRILVMGLPQNGKTWIASHIGKKFSIPHWDADVVRNIYNDWDFSEEGRIRQAFRMHNLSCLNPISISSFICPTEETVRIFDPEVIIWMDKIPSSIYEDTNKTFEQPINYDVRITKWIDKNQLSKCLDDINHGMTDIQSFLNELIVKLGKLQ
tara:strand:+ start:513 stop:971 length:459 start_codon:yes stop_codon:yes gene_type:complete